MMQRPRTDNNGLPKYGSLFVDEIHERVTRKGKHLRGKITPNISVTDAAIVIRFLHGCEEGTMRGGVPRGAAIVAMENITNLTANDIAKLWRD
jgi:hypothetical protein